MRTAFQHNFIPAMFVLGHGVVSMNAELVASRLDCCPVTVAVGASGLGKTMALKTALSMIGENILHCLIIIQLYYLHVLSQNCNLTCAM